MKVILAGTMREAELLAYLKGIPPKGRDTILVATDKPSSPNTVRNVICFREDVIFDERVARKGRFHDEVMRTLEPHFLD